MSKMSNTLAFLMGIAIGGVATWFYTEDKYARITEEEIASVKEAYAKREEKAVVEKPSREHIAEKASITEYAKRIQQEGYVDYSKTIPPKEPIKEAPGKTPYVISPDEFGEVEEYTKISLVYYDDGILADEDNVVIKNVEVIVGDALTRFGEFEDDAVFVRDDAKRCDYEILMDPREFSDVLKTLPPQHNEEEED